MRLIFSTLIVLAVAASAIASESQQSGFLSSYDGFEDGPEGGVDKIWTNPKFEFPKGLARYKAFYFDPIAVQLSEEGRGRGVDVAELATLAKKLHDQLTTQIQAGGYTLAPEPGPGTLRFIIALTDVEPSNTTMDAITSVVPMARVFSFVKKQVTGQHSFVGSASVEGVIVDGDTGETIIAFFDKQSGDKGVFGGSDSMEDVNEAFEHWAKRLRLVLDKAHGKPANQ